VHQSFISYRRFRYGVVGLGLCLAALVVYLTDATRELPRGSTWVGYGLGTVAALIVCWLAAYGIRRRSFRLLKGSASGWLSAHVYLGIASLLVATLHCGFQFGRNVHTLTYVLLFLVVVSGCWGVYAYARYPAMIVRQRGDASRETLLDDLRRLDQRAQTLAMPLDASVRALVDEAIRRTHLGGGLWTQLRGRDLSAIVVLQTERGQQFARAVSNEGQHVLIRRLAQEHAAAADAAHAARLKELLDVAGEKAVLVGKLQKDIQLQGLLQFWLYIHLPLCFGLLAALAIHVLAVFLYW
jgi:hypothetical protein